MLTVRYRFNERFRPIEADPQFLTLRKDELPASPRVVHVEPESIVETTDEEKEDERLKEQIRQLEEENRTLRQENLLFSRYLRRTQTSKVLETFADYGDERNFLDFLDGTNPSRSSRRGSVRKSSTFVNRAFLPGPKLPTEDRSRSRAQVFHTVEQERLPIATYEFEQTRLEWERMVINGDIALEQLKILFRIALSDENTQARLNREVEQYVDRYRMFIGDREFRNPRLKVPAKLVIARINKRVYSRVSMIGQVRVSNIHLRTRLEEVNMKMRNLNELYSRMDEVDITCTISNTEKTSNVDKYISLNQEYLTEKFGQYPNHHRLLKTRRVLEDEDKALSDIKKKIDILQHISQETQREIDAFQDENAFITQENSVLKPRLESVRQVPTIIDYAYTIKQTKFLQHEIEKWTKRVNMVEAFLSQLQQQSRSTRLLPPLQVNRRVQQRSMEPVSFV